MVKTKSRERVVEKWVSRVAVAGPEYEAGIKSPKADWADQAKKAEGNYEAGVQAAIAKKKFGKGVTAAGTEKWRKNALAKGPSRFRTGVAAARDDYSNAMGDVLAAIEGVTLPERGPKGSPQNYDRSRSMGEALHEFAERRKGA